MGCTDDNFAEAYRAWVDAGKPGLTADESVYRHSGTVVERVRTNGEWLTIGVMIDEGFASYVAEALNALAADGRAQLAAGSTGGEAAREAPPNDLSNWRVRHPGLGVLTYPDETTARTAAGTAGRVFGPGESHHTDTP